MKENFQDRAIKFVIYYTYLTWKSITFLLTNRNENSYTFDKILLINVYLLCTIDAIFSVDLNNGFKVQLT